MGGGGNWQKGGWGVGGEVTCRLGNTTQRVICLYVGERGGKGEYNWPQLSRLLHAVGQNCSQGQATLPPPTHPLLCCGFLFSDTTAMLWLWCVVAVAVLATVTGSSSSRSNLPRLHWANYGHFLSWSTIFFFIVLKKILKLFASPFCVIYEFHAHIII